MFRPALDQHPIPGSNPHTTFSSPKKHTLSWGPSDPDTELCQGAPQPVLTFAQAGSHIHSFVPKRNLPWTKGSKILLANH